MDGQAIMVTAGAVVALTQLVKWGGLPDKWGPASVMLLALFGVLLWGFSFEETYDRKDTFDYFAGWITVATSAAGVFGFTRAAGTTLTAMHAPPSGAGQNATVKS